MFILAASFTATAQSAKTKTSKNIKAMNQSLIESNRKIVDNFFVALETQKFEMLKEVFAENGKQLNPDFAVEIVARFSNTKQIRISGYFLNEKIVNYLEFKKCSERLSCEGFGSRSRFQVQNLGLIHIRRQAFPKALTVQQEFINNAADLLPTLDK